MKQHEKWLYEVLDNEEAKKFEIETGNITTFDQALFKVSETAWRGALEMIKREIFEHREALDVIEEELES